MAKGCAGTGRRIGRPILHPIRVATPDCCAAEEHPKELVTPVRRRIPFREAAGFERTTGNTLNVPRASVLLASVVPLPRLGTRGPTEPREFYRKTRWHSCGPNRPSRLLF